MRASLRALAYALVLLVLAAGLFWWNLQPARPLAVPKRGLRLADVTLIEPGVSRSPKRSLVVEGDRISESGAAQDTVDAFAGHYVLPGLVDAHVHFPPASLVGHAELWSFLFLYHGVTAVRDAGDLDGTSTAPARDGVREGRLPGPRVFACGPFLDGEPPSQANSLVLRTPDDARRAVARLDAEGFDCLKAYNQLEPEVLAALRVAAHEHHLPLIGHVPWRVSYEDARLDDVQHMTHLPGSWDHYVPYPEVMQPWLTLDDARLEQIAEVSLREGIAITPTLVSTERRIGMEDGAQAGRAADALLLPRLWRDVVWGSEGLASGHTAEDSELLRAALPQMQRAVRYLHARGVSLRTGTDAPTPFVVPGASLHRELRLLVAAGLTPEQALAASTGESARALGVAGPGRFQPGAPADLVIFREDPTRDLAALDTITAVVASGRLYTRETLDRQLALYREQFENPIYDAVMTAVVRRLLASSPD